MEAFQSNPHDHRIDWGNGLPSFSGPISYFDGAIPEFMSFIGGLMMTSTMFPNDSERDRFQTVDEFKDCIGRGGEVVFQWGQAEYGVGLFNPFLHSEESGNPKPQLQYCVAHTDGSQDKWYRTPEDVLEYMIGNERLGDIITKAEILYRTI